ncbi:MAG: hypothetical protein OXI26_04770 [bacterium]|nr:hypothetical protein [bacterium]
MDSIIVASLIGALGAAFITVLIYFLQSLRDDIRAVGARIDRMGPALESRLDERIDKMESRLGARIDSVESRLTGIDEKLVRMEATLEAHGRLLAGMADHGERIAALEGAVSVAS